MSFWILVIQSGNICQINEYRIESGKREELLKLAVISAESIDKSFQFWQEQIKQIADISLINNAPIQSNQVLGNIISKSKFFNQLSVFDVNGKFITGSPQNDGALQQFPDAMKNLAKSIEKNNKDIPVIVLTSSQEECDVDECYRLGVNSYVVKPVEFSRFEDVVKEIGFYWLSINQPLLED